jgi:hypothetical protein
MLAQSGVADLPARCLAHGALPLLPADPDVSLDMHAAVQACFELVGYERLLDYSSPPPPPELSADDAAWVDEALRAAGYR